MPQAVRTQMRLHARHAILLGLILALFRVSVNPASSTSTNLRPTISKLVSGNTFEIALYTVTDPDMRSQNDQEPMTNSLFEVLGTENLKSSIRTSSMSYEKTLNMCEEKQASFDVVWIKEIQDEKHHEMALTLTVRRVGSVAAELHHHPDINNQPVGQPCTYTPLWKKCRSDKFKDIADVLAALDRNHGGGK